MKRALLLGLCAIGLPLLIFLCSMPQTSGSPGFGDTPRGPISINGDSQFNSDNGVNGGGDGTAGNPYIIENWVISASTANGISIQNTTAYFVIRNCLVENGGGYSGIYLNNVINGRIENNTCSSNKYGIYLFFSCNYNNLTGNTCSNNESGIYLRSSSYDNLTGNTCGLNGDYGIYLDSSCNYDNLTGNTCSNNSRGIYLKSSCNYNNLTGNTCGNNGDGIYLKSSNNSTITLNHLLNNTTNNAYDNGTNAWDNEVAQKGNYWDNWQPPAHPDADNNGVVDTSYLIAGGTNQDNYPLVLNAPNKPTNLQPSTRQTTTDVTISCVDTDNDSVKINIFFYDNSTKNLIDNIWIDNNTTASVIWSGLTQGNTYTFFARGQDNDNKSGENSDTQSFLVNSLPTAPTNFTDLGMNLTDHTPEVTWTKGTDADGDTVTTCVYCDTNSLPTTLENSTTGTAENLGENSITFTDGTTYYYRLRSWDGYEWSASYTTADQFRMNTPPAASNQLVGGQVNPTHLMTFTPTPSWSYSDNDNDVQSNYQIQVGTAENDNSMWDNTGTTLTQITYSGDGLSRSVTYYSRVRVKDGYEWSSWATGTFKLNSSPTVTVGDSTIELTLLEAGDTLVIPTSTFTMRLTVRTSVDTLLIYYARIDELPQIPTTGNIAPFYFDISTTNPDAIADATITFNIPKSWVVANNIIPSTLVAWRNSNGTWQTLPSRLVGEDLLYYYLEATTSGFSLFGVSGQKKVVTTTENQQSSPQTPDSDQQIQQVIFIATLGILIISVMILVSSFNRHK